MRPADAAALVPTPFADGVATLPAEGGPSGADWVAALPRLLSEVAPEWGLVVDGPAAWGRTALVLPVLVDGSRAALKLGWPHEEARGEHLALRAWDGRGAVRLLRADPARSVMLLERLSTQDLGQVWDEEACQVVAGLHRELHVPALAQLPRLSTWATRQMAALEQVGDALPRRLVTQARSLVRDLVADPACDATLVHTDLHYANVLSDGTDWVAIDPKPMAGHPAFEMAPMLWNRADEMGTGPAFRWSVRRRLEVLCEGSGTPWEVARDWSVVREVVGAAWAVEDGDRDRVSLAVQLIKALGD